MKPQKLSLLVLTCACFALLSAAPSRAQMPDPPGQVAPGQKPAVEAYLFSHMIEGDYGRLYYTVSRDGLHWQRLNNGKCVFPEYHGHSSIVKGHDGEYYLVGNRSDNSPVIHFWASSNLATWKNYSDVEPDLKHVPDYPTALQRIGAPKLFYDDSTSQYLLTWHTTHDMGKTDLPEPYWAGQRTLYMTSPDLKTFSEPPRKLFDWDMATIDVSILKHEGRYYAVLKDERYPTVDWPTGKTVRICSSTNLLGPYSKPGPPLSPSFREAPMLIASPNGKAWYLYYEQYPGVAYGLSAAVSLNGPWFQVAGNQRAEWDKFSMPAKLRHGCMIPISASEYDALVAAFGISTE